MFISDMRRDLTHVIEDGYETVLTEQRKLNGEDELHFWQLRQSGLLFVKQVLREDTRALATGNSRFLDFYTFSMSTAEAVHCLVKLYEGQLDDSEEVVLRFSLTGIENRPLGSSNPSRHIRPSMHTCHARQITYENCRPLADWRAGLIDHALAICEYVFQRFNWENPNLHESRKLIEKMLERKL